MAEEDDKKKRPIIVKKVKKVSGGHHGGAWKVAYADFVTAMMAFFLLLWLLSSSSKATLEGIAEYFTPTTGVKDSQGIGFKGGAADSVKGVAKSDMADPGVVVGRASTGVIDDNPETPAPEEDNKDDNLFREGAAAITQAMSQDKALQPYKDNVAVTQTPEGLRLDIVDSDKFPMFEQSSPVLTEHGQLVLGKMAQLLKRMPNYVAITGHTDASPAEAGSTNYSNWELSTDRAQAARRFLLKSGMDPERPKRVVGMADKELLDKSQPRSPRNRRISILMLRGSHMLIPDGAVPENAPPM